MILVHLVQLLIILSKDTLHCQCPKRYLNTLPVKNKTTTTNKSFNEVGKSNSQNGSCIFLLNITNASCILRWNSMSSVRFWAFVMHFHLSVFSSIASIYQSLKVCHISWQNTWTKKEGKISTGPQFQFIIACLPSFTVPMGWDWTSQWGPCGRSRDETEDLGIFYRNKFQKEGGGPRDFWVILTPGRTSLFIRLIWVTDLTSNTDYISWQNICLSGVEEPVSSVRSESLLLDGTYTIHQLI